MKNLLCLATAVTLLASCSDSSTKTTAAPVKDSATASSNHPSLILNTTGANETKADAATIMARTQVPILCYHHIRDIQMASRADRGYEVTVAEFKAQMKALADSGYHTILPDQLYAYLTKGTPLPSKPVMLTYDDTDEEQFSIAKPEMDKYGFKGVYFIMTISIGRPRYMTKEQIKQLSDEGHVIASHTWDHHRVDRLKNENTIEYRGQKKVVNEWDFQLTNTRTQLEEITGKPVYYFAYPFGIWSKEALPEIEKRGYKMAFQLATPRDSAQPLYTVRRMIVSPEWSASGVIKVMKSTFK
ncbi:polysaccharide deacetylase family protein [Flavisolibacter tropicus]|uniref:Polysaccharide deacetylase n=1 Tax=Flavisolibacter tropicus TaxID=1492898 RepID=A0A172TU82_9BACT|nr:polysaccharide deacetylase family protein [Flavisolibacter tropicus]ANE50434.1 polysaccharide deacetylase [Flavisolibacter tropicus]